MQGLYHLSITYRQECIITVDYEPESSPIPSSDYSASLQTTLTPLKLASTSFFPRRSRLQLLGEAPRQ